MLSIDPPLLLLTVVVFLGLIYVLNVMLYKPILAFIDARNDSIVKDEENLLKQGDDTKAYKEEADAILAQARTEVASIKAAAIAKASEEAAARVAERKADLEAEYKEFFCQGRSWP